MGMVFLMLGLLAGAAWLAAAMKREDDRPWR